MNWQWDTSEVPTIELGVSVKRWRRGPVTFYRYIIHPSKDGTFTSYWMYIANDLGFAIHLPNWLMDRINGEKFTSRRPSSPPPPQHTSSPASRRRENENGRIE